MVIDIKKCAQLINEHSDFLVISHEHPDGDTLGCAFALCEILRLMGKKRKFLCADEISKDFRYMTDSHVDDNVENPFIVAVDVAAEKLLGAIGEEYSGNIDLCIDHHMSNTDYARYTLLEDRAAACELIYELAKHMEIPLNRYIRECIYTGVSTDTGCFRYPNTTARTMSIGAELMAEGIDAQKIIKLMFETKTKTFLALEQLVRDTLEYHFDGKCAILTITYEMYKKSGSNEHECHPITALPRQIEGVLVGAVIKEQKDGTYSISVRTDGQIDAAAICGALGGGGHKGAAGARFSVSYEEGKQQLLSVVGKAIEVYK